MSKIIKILHIDDDELICKVTRAFLLQSGGFEVQSYLSVEEALRAIHAYSPDLIIVDFIMPDMEGMDSLLNLKADRRLVEVPVIYATGLDQSRVREHLGDNIAGYIKKPYQMDELISQIHQILKDYTNLKN